MTRNDYRHNDYIRLKSCIVFDAIILPIPKFNYMFLMIKTIFTKHLQYEIHQIKKLKGFCIAFLFCFNIEKLAFHCNRLYKYTAKPK